MIVNLTPHPINLPTGEFRSKGLARVQQTTEFIGKFDEIDLTRSTFGEVTGLPPQSNGVLYVVSAMVRLALPNRIDLASPSLIVRNDNGLIVGCNGLEVNR